jgi:methylenetetrahydrofolate reductase (NADPH)
MSVSVSFEVFPPKTPEGLRSLAETVARLDEADPAYISVTYGAGGSDRQRSFDAIETVRSASSAPVAAHLTCVGQSRREIDEVIEHYLALGVEHIVALRGDPPGGIDGAYRPHPEGFSSTDELVAAIKAREPGLAVSVSAYPERHPQSPTDDHDLDVLAAKVGAGADQAMTQMFFDNASYLEYVRRVRARGIGVRIVPGIFPIHSFPTVERFAQRCGASMPTAIAQRFDGHHDDPAATHAIASELAAGQIGELAEHDVDHVHLYTLNRPELALAVCHRLSLVAA